MFQYDKETGKARMYGPIGDFEGGISAVDFMEMLDDMEGRDVTIRLQSEGGDVLDGFSIFNQIRDYSGKLTFEIDAYAASIATVFPMAAAKIMAFENSTIMIHEAWTVRMGNKHDLRETADILDKLDNDIASMYAGRSGREAAYWLDLMSSTTHLTASGAVESGLIDGILPNGTAPPVDVQGRQVIMAPVDQSAADNALKVAAAARGPNPRLAALQARVAARKLTLRRHRIID